MKHSCRFVVLIMDEMKIHEDLVYDKTGSCLHGYVNLGDVNNQLQQLELHTNGKKPQDFFATHMLTLMVRGIFIKLEFPYASFPTEGTVHTCTMYIHTCTLCISVELFMHVKTGVTGEMLYWIMWEAVRRLEEINLKVCTCITSHFLIMCLLCMNIYTMKNSLCLHDIPIYTANMHR